MKKKRFVVSGTVTISISTNVEASNKEEAIEKAEERSMPGFCWSCGGNPDVEWATSGELDGTPENLISEKQ